VRRAVRDGVLDIVPVRTDDVALVRQPAAHARSTSNRVRRSRLFQAVVAHPGLVVAVLLLGIALDRALVIGRGGEPSGLDFGNWLQLGHQILGHPLRGAAKVSYPPIVPVFAVAVTHVFGLVWGEALAAGFAGIAPSAGVYFAARLCGARWPAVPAVVLLAATSSTGEAVAWGGVPQLVGFGFAAAAIGVAARLMVERSPKFAGSLGGLLLLLGATSHLVFAQTALVLTVLVALRVATTRGVLGRGNWWGTRGWLATVAMALGPLVVLVPLYVVLLRTVGQSFASEGSSRGWAGLVALSRNLWIVYRDCPWFWKPALLLATAVPVRLLRRRHRRESLWLVAAALVASLLLQAMWSDESRLAYLAPVAVAFALALWLASSRDATTLNDVHRRPRIAVSVVLVGAVAYASWTGLAFFPKQRAYYGSLVPKGTLAGLDWLRHNTPADALVAVPPERTVPFGWWVQGYGRRAALVGSDDQWLNFPQERQRAEQAVALFTADDPVGDDVMRKADELHVSYLVIPWLWGGLTDSDVNALRRSHPGSVVFDNDALVVVKVVS